MGDDVEVLAAAGRALYGERWQSPMARDLDTTDRTMRNWVGRVHPVPTHVRGRIELLLAERSQLIETVLASIRA